MDSSYNWLSAMWNWAVFSTFSFCFHLSHLYSYSLASLLFLLLPIKDKSSVPSAASPIAFVIGRCLWRNTSSNNIILFLLQDKRKKKLLMDLSCYFFIIQFYIYLFTYLFDCLSRKHCSSLLKKNVCRSVYCLFFLYHILFLLFEQE